MVRTPTNTDEAYATQARRKEHSRDSFSKVILRLVRQPPDPLAFAGAWDDMGDEEAEALIATSRRHWGQVGRHWGQVGRGR